MGYDLIWFIYVSHCVTLHAKCFFCDSTLGHVCRLAFDCAIVMSLQTNHLLLYIYIYNCTDTVTVDLYSVEANVAGHVLQRR